MMRIVAASSILAVFVEYPFLEIRRVLFDNVTRRKIEFTPIIKETIQKRLNDKSDNKIIVIEKYD